MEVLYLAGFCFCISILGVFLVGVFLRGPPGSMQ